MTKKTFIFIITVFCLFSITSVAFSQEKTISHSRELWSGLYTKYRISEKMFYYGEYHYRRRDDFVNEMAQVYLRFGLTRLVNKNLEITAGVVTPIYYAPKSQVNNPSINIDETYMQFRLWQQVVLVQPFNRLKLYHQFRTEQRWRRPNYEVGSPYNMDWRFRYRITGYYPLNGRKLIPTTLFLSFYEEIFIQAGKKITYDHFEDNRAFLGLGYILNDNVQVQAGYLWSFRYNGGPTQFQHRHIPKISIYHNLDFYGNKQRKKRMKPLILNDNL